MNSKGLLLCLLATSLLQAVDGSSSAEAQGVKVDRKALEKTRWYKAPVEIQIIDETAGRGALDPSLINSLPKSGFESNYRPAVVMPKVALPSGTSNNVMLNRRQNRSAGTVVPSRPSASGLSAGSRTPPVAATYKDGYGSVSNRGTLFNRTAPSTVQTTVSGEVKRGSLLHK